jgi:integrase
VSVCQGENYAPPKNANARDKVLSYEEYNKLLSKLPQHTKAIVAMAFWSGMRRGELLNLTWDKVDLKK